MDEHRCRNGHYLSEVTSLLETQANQMLKAVTLCLAEDLWEPALILMLSFIDACAWLVRPVGAADVRQDDFVRWVDTYLLPGSRLDCTAEELYGARCGLLHSLTGESRLHRLEQIRKIFWARRAGDDIYQLVQLRMNEKHLPVGIGIDHFFAAFGVAMQRFGQAIDENAQMLALVAERVHKSYFTKVQALS